MLVDSNLKLRSGLPGDACTLSLVAGKLFRQAYAGKMPDADLQACIAEDFGEQQQLDELADPSVSTLLAEQDGELVGYAQVRRKPIPVDTGPKVECELWRIYLDTSCQGQGLGRQLLAAVKDVALAMPSERIWLGVWEENESAIAFYRKHGFEVVGSQPFHLGDEVHNDLVMVGSVENLDHQGDG